jgi:hypothetical protein
MSLDRTVDFRYSPPSSWTAICRPDDPYKTLVREDGALLYDFQLVDINAAYFGRVLEFGAITDHPPITITQRTESADIPVVITTLHYRRATLELTTFAHQDHAGRRTDVVLWTVKATNDADEVLTGLRIDAVERDRVFTSRTAAPDNVIYAVPPAQVPRRNVHDLLQGRSVEVSDIDPASLAFVSVPHQLQAAYPMGFRPASAFAVEPHILRAGESLSGAVLVPLNHHEVADLDLDWAKAALENERRFWQVYHQNWRRIEVPDNAIMEMISASARNIMQAREVKDGLPVFQVGATVYRSLFVIDGHFMLECAHYLGYRDDVAGALDRLLQSVAPDGSIAEMPFHLKETAIALATIVRQCELLGDDERLRGYWNIVRGGVSYIERLRDEAAALPPDSPAHKLMPPSFGDGGAGGKRPEYTTTLWTLSGLKMVTDAARRLGYAEDAERFASTYDALMTDFRRCAARDMRHLPDGTPYLPMIMSGSGEHHDLPDFPSIVSRPHQLQPASATWAFCQTVWPGEVFAPDDPFVRNLLQLLDQLDDEQGIPAETGWYPYRSVWTYYASFAAHAWLYAGRPDKAIDYLYDFANHAAPTRVWREEQSFSDTYNGQFCGDMPHNWASAEFIRLVRHLVVFEVGETLHLLPGLPAQWRIPGKRILVERTPTRFGDVTLALAFDVDGTSELRVSCDSAGHRAPTKVVLHAARIADVRQIEIDGHLAEVGSDGTLELQTIRDSVIRIPRALG